jgi:hypothetical protein
MDETPRAPRFGTVWEAKLAGPWTVAEQMPDGQWVNAGAMTEEDHREKAAWLRGQ